MATQAVDLYEDGGGHLILTIGEYVLPDLEVAPAGTFEDDAASLIKDGPVGCGWQGPILTAADEPLHYIDEYGDDIGYEIDLDDMTLVADYKDGKMTVYESMGTAATLYTGHEA